jgi:hypothetical protein
VGANAPIAAMESASTESRRPRFRRLSPEMLRDLAVAQRTHRTASIIVQRWPDTTDTANVIIRTEHPAKQPPGL